MNSVADLGGVHGFGLIEREENEPVFHASWERLIFGIDLSVESQGFCPTDEVRHGVERMHPSSYLSSRYYERWMAALVWIMVERGLLAEGEVDGRARLLAKEPHALPPTRHDPAVAKLVLRAARNGAPKQREVTHEPLFRIGDRVVGRNMHPPGHTRLPRYVRGREGVVERGYGAFVFPDTVAHGQGENPQYLYSVRFDGHELWGDSAEPNTAVHLDLLEPYLEALPEGRS